MAERYKIEESNQLDLFTVVAEPISQFKASFGSRKATALPVTSPIERLRTVKSVMRGTGQSHAARTTAM